VTDRQTDGQTPRTDTAAIL